MEGVRESPAWVRKESHGTDLLAEVAMTPKNKRPFRRGDDDHQFGEPILCSLSPLDAPGENHGARGGPGLYRLRGCGHRV
jgi:hypothetical protein